MTQKTLKPLEILMFEILKLPYQLPKDKNPQKKISKPSYHLPKGSNLKKKKKIFEPSCHLQKGELGYEASH